MPGVGTEIRHGPKTGAFRRYEKKCSQESGRLGERHLSLVSGQRSLNKFVCDLKAYVIKNIGEELLLESVSQVRVEHGEVTLRNLFGEEKKILGEVREVSLAKNRIVIAGE